MSEPTLVELIERYEAASQEAMGDAYDAEERWERGEALNRRLFDLGRSRVKHRDREYHWGKVQPSVFFYQPIHEAAELDADFGPELGIELAAIMSTKDNRVLGFRTIADAHLAERDDWEEVWTSAGWLRRCEQARRGEDPPRMSR